MRKLISIMLVIGFIAMAGTAIAWDFSSAYSRSTSFTYAPTGFGSSSSTAFGCGDCLTLNTRTYSTTTTFDGWNGSISTAGAYASANTIICEEPPVCEDGDADGVCNESDNCPDTPNTDQTDTDDDQIGDACDNCPDNPNTDQRDWDLNGVGDVCDPTGCDGYLPEGCIHGDPNTDCTPQYPDFGTCEPTGCDDCPPPPPTCEEDDTACLLEEACPCENDWRNHGAYVTCTVQFRNDNTIQGVPQLPDLEHIVSEAGCSDCGGSHQGQGCD